jgi:hypothetical protein
LTLITLIMFATAPAGSVPTVRANAPIWISMARERNIVVVVNSAPRNLRDSVSLIRDLVSSGDTTAHNGIELGSVLTIRSHAAVPKDDGIRFGQDIYTTRSDWFKAYAEI